MQDTAVKEDMKNSGLSSIRHASGRQSAATVPPLLFVLLLVLVQPITSQVYVNSSSYDGNASASERTDQMQPSLGPSQLTGRTEMPLRTNDQKLEIDKNASVEVSKEKDIISTRHSEEPASSGGNMGETSTYPSSTTQLAPRNTKPKDGLTQTQQPPVRDHTTTQIQQVGGHTDEMEASARPQGSSTATETRPGTEEQVNESSEEDWLASDVLIPTVGLVESSAETMAADGAELAQYRPQAKTAYKILTTSYKAQPQPTVSLASQSKPSTTTLVNEKPTAPSAATAVNVRSTMNLTGVEKEAQESRIIPTEGQSSKGSSQSSSHSPSPSQRTTLDTSTTRVQIRTLPPRETPATSTNQQQRNATHAAKASTNQQPKEAESHKTSPQRPGTTTIQGTTLSPPKGRGRSVLLDDARYVEKDLSISLGNMPSVKPGSIPSTTYIYKGPCDPVSNPCASPKDPNVLSEPAAANGSLLVWADLSRTLSFAWELHVFGSAALFLLLTAGSALGLALAPSMHCPHRGALALANGLLLLAGAIRAAYFLLDPYGSRLLLPVPVVTALYTLPLPLLIWVQAAMVVLVLKGADVALLPPSLQQPPLLGVLAVLQCTLLLAADLLSPALSPAVPVVLQSLTLTAGLALCLGYLFLVLPRLSHPQVGHVGDKGVSGAKLRVLARVLAVCALLGALCCLLHAYTCLWLYGLLGDWRRFRWTWWLCQFWARLLELGWAFCLLLLTSWVFWRPQGGQTRRASAQGGTAVSDLPSPGQSSSASQTHTCWAKIVQSLKGRPHRKSDSNGVGGSNSSGVPGELPNNWAGQERSGADISKSLIRNRDPPKESNRGRNQRSGAESSAGSLLRLQALGQQRQCSLSSSLDRDKESAISLYDFDLRPPSPIDLSRSIDEALHREHLLRGGSLFRPLGLPSPPPSPGPWMRRNSDPQITLSESSDEHTLLTESSAALDRSIPSAVPSRQVTAPPTPTHQGPRWASEAPVPSSISCPVSLHPSPSMGRAASPSTDDTRPFLTPDLDRAGSQPDIRGGRSYLKVSRQDDSASVSSDIIDL